MSKIPSKTTILKRHFFHFCALKTVGVDFERGNGDKSADQNAPNPIQSGLGPAWTVITIIGFQLATTVANRPIEID